jgi:predicted transcriptional regulator
MEKPKTKGRRIDVESIHKCKNIISSLDDVIEAYGMKKEFIIEKSEIPRSTFFHKHKNKSFTLDELLKIANIING